MNQSSPSRVVYGSHYGSTKRYALAFAKSHDYPCDDIHHIHDLTIVSTIYAFVAIYAGGLVGLKQLVKRLDANQILIVITVGIADPQSSDTIKDRDLMVNEHCLNHPPIRIYHLRGSIDHNHLKWHHKMMMKIMHTMLKHQQSYSSSDQAFLDTYGQTNDFVDLDQLKAIE